MAAVKRKRNGRASARSSKASASTLNTAADVSCWDPAAEARAAAVEPSDPDPPPPDKSESPIGRPKLQPARAVKLLTMLGPRFWINQSVLIRDMGVDLRTFHKVVSEARSMLRPVKVELSVRRSYETLDMDGNQGWVSYYRCGEAFDSVVAKLSEAKI